MSYPPGPHNRFTALFAVATLPLGILAFMFFGLEIAVAVFVVGWLLLVPASAVLFGPSWEKEAADELEAVGDLQAAANRLDTGYDDGGTGGEDSIETLRDRYASGEIDEIEFERRLEALLETEGLDPTDEAALKRAVDRLDDVKPKDRTATDRERELE